MLLMSSESQLLLLFVYHMPGGPVVLDGLSRGYQKHVP